MIHVKFHFKNLLYHKLLINFNAKLLLIYQLKLFLEIYYKNLGISLGKMSVIFPASAILEQIIQTVQVTQFTNYHLQQSNYTDISTIRQVEERERCNCNFFHLF